MIRSLLIVLLIPAMLTAAEPETFAVALRSRVTVAQGVDRHHTIATKGAWPAAKTAVILCDLWDKHDCPGAEARVAELASRVNAFANAARAKGALIVHCPSDCMEFYKDTPQRNLALAMPKADPKVPLEKWCKFDGSREGKWPIDDAGSGCEEPTTGKKPWTRQHSAIEIKDGDAVGDGEEVFHLLKARGIERVLIAGVHANRCVLGRPFGIRQLVRQGFQVALVRDLTDTMYSSKDAPFVNHFTGTDLVVEHIEKYWCPSIISGDLLDGKEFRFKSDKRPTVVIVAAEDEYKTEETLPPFALKHLGDWRVQFIFADVKEKNRLPGIDQLKSADLLLLSQRRKPLVKDDMAVVKSYFAAAKPLVAIRTSSHAFAPKKGEKLPVGVVEWPAFDKEILGCNYANHYPQKVDTKLSVPEASSHPIINHISGGRFESKSGLYKSNPLTADCVVLLEGRSGDYPVEPVAWVRERTKERGRMAYIALAHTSDFASEAFPKMLAKACHWANSP